MRASRMWIPTKRHVPQEAKSLSHQWMLRAGFIHPSASGLYAWMPMGFRVLKRLIHCVQKAMDVHADAILLPSLQPTSLWEESGRLQSYGQELFQLRDRRRKSFLLAPTHEEGIGQLFGAFPQLLEGLPKCFYQIQSKFRDEKRPRSGVIRAREFIMKDAYSFHANELSLQAFYATMAQTYHQIFQKLELQYATVPADSGPMGGTASEEFHAFCEAGEDRLVLNETEHAAQLADEVVCSPQAASAKNIAWFSLSHLLPSAVKGLKLILDGEATPNFHKIKKAFPHLNLEAAPPEPIEAGAALAACKATPTTLLVDHSALPWVQAYLKDDPSSAHSLELLVGDYRYPYEEEVLPSGNRAHLRKSLEVAHIFQLGDRYTQNFNPGGAPQTQGPILMGCYGIGISRLCAAIIEQKCDGKRMVWPEAVAPFQVALIPVARGEERNKIEACAASLEHQLEAAGVSVLWDDREIRLGAKLKDLELWGIQHWVWIGHQFFQTGQIEYCHILRQENKTLWDLKDWIDEFLRSHPQEPLPLSV